MVTKQNKQIGLVTLGTLVGAMTLGTVCIDDSKLFNFEKDYTILCNALDNKLLFTDVSDPVSYLNSQIPTVLNELKNNQNYSGSFNNYPIKVLSVVRPVKWGDDFSLELEIADHKRIYKY